MKLEKVRIHIHIDNDIWDNIYSWEYDVLSFNRIFPKWCYRVVKKVGSDIKSYDIRFNRPCIIIDMVSDYCSKRFVNTLKEDIGINNDVYIEKIDDIELTEI